MSWTSTARDEVVEPCGFRAKRLRTVDVCGLSSERRQGLAFAHGLSELASGRGFGGLAEFEVTDCFAERAGKDLAMGRCPTELVDRPVCGSRIERCIEGNGGVSDAGFVLFPRANGLGQHTLRNLNGFLAQLEDRSKLETER